MKRITFLALVCFLFFTGCRTNKPVAEMKANVSQKTETSSAADKKEVNFSEQSTWLLGYFNQRQLRQEPHSAWFYKGYDDYHPDPNAINSLSGIDMEGLTIKVVLGTWCPDSRREVPRFMKVVDGWKFPSGMVTFIGVDNGKLSPIGEYDKLEIQRVPTFIFYKNNIEAGRIIENPMTSLEQDMVNILRGMNNNK
ncbi:MAG: thioredoxin family protein [Bacteroidales bacterium]|nr:thioredoxin family protein [Bacteroidales bacterium]